MRHYRHKGTGRVYPSVTAIIPDLFADVPDSALKAAQIRGTWVHEATALADRDNLDDTGIPGTYAPFLEAWDMAKKELILAIDPDWIERPVVSNLHGFAGTMDRVVTIGAPIGTPVIIDIKTGDSSSKEMKDNWGLQTAGYELLYREVTGRKATVKRAVVQLRSDGTYRFYPLDDPSDRAAFLHFLGVHKWKVNHGWEE